MSKTNTKATGEMKDKSIASYSSRLRILKKIFNTKINRPYFARLAAWQARNLAASMVLALLELLHVPDEPRRLFPPAL